ncbi:NAD(P)H-hydrate dehydratase [Natronoflexus pectinivorans]|uniref:Bifunctional NAD(P)H-hydrate repair enzyme n=1 Tax=Natronoflexus pectinivorans TaxID=682526 RepID=A0A4R2GLT8_9BACT|nr:NAD(P)H-hydrate dehydratase [Natronoflexus pectinivorans]TCO09913.1 NAD(P)H-hydrate epimerase [Natronoflexus pectinivorans]
MKIFPVKSIAEIDQYTIENEPILSINLMERASRRLFDVLDPIYRNRPFVVVAGAGNNGGDALALSRMLLLAGYDTTIVLLKSDCLSTDTALNLERLKHIRQSKVILYQSVEDLPSITSNHVIVDGLFGSGLNRPLEGKALELVQWMNELNVEIVSIDIPSGLMGEDNSGNNPEGIVKARRTFTFQFPKLSFLFPENHKYTGQWEIIDIGLHPEKISEITTSWYFIDRDICRNLLPQRSCFDHKGTMGHTLLIAGSYGKMGAAVLSARACLKSGTGLLTVQVPHDTCQIMHAAVPEAMVNIDRSDLMFTEFPNLSTFSAIGVGPGIGIRSNAVKALDALLDSIGDRPLILDADAINIIAQNPHMKEKLPPGAILTPHPGEFKRLVGEWDNDFERLEKAKEFAAQHKVILVLKGAYTTVVLPSGVCYFNSTGNPGMATAGSGDVLTGIILAMLGRKMDAWKAAVAGVYIHGLAGDIACETEGEEALIASDIISSLGKAFINTK